jgi:outer membrane protein OmpA-like peptidoglycan-associated protein
MSHPAAPTILRPGELVALGYWLRDAGMRVHPGQIIAATRLLASARRPPPVAELAPWLAPIFCTNAVEQEAFRGLYVDWLRHTGVPIAVDDNDPHDANDPEVKKPPPRRRRWPIALLLSLLIWLLLPLLLVGDGVVLRGQGKQPDKPGEQPAVTAQVTKNESSRTYSNMRQLDLVAPPPTVTLPGQQVAATAPLNLALRITGVIILLVALNWWLYGAARRRGFLERLPADDDTTRRRLATSACPALGGYASALRYLGREMRRRRATPSRRMDVRATLAATMRAGGLPAPVFGSVAEPVYVVLVERVSAVDHQAELSDEVVRLFHAQGVAVERYEFDGDPRFVRHAPLEGAPLHTGTQSLEALLARHPDSCLIIFSDGNSLVDRYTGMPHVWVSGLLEWLGTVLITPQPGSLWTQREWALAQTGLTILPLNANGLRGLGQFVREQTSWEAIDRNARRRTRQAYLRDPDLLVDRRPLEADALDDVLRDLERDLGRQGLEWLAACAVYPDIHWAITLAVGDSIADEQRRGDRYAQRLAQLSRLPWMRMGFMPDWLRSALLARLSPASEAKVRAALDAFLAAVKTSTEQQASALEIAIAPRRRAWNDVRAGLRAWRRLARRDDAREDAIFLRFMSGPRKPLAVDAGKALMRLLYRGSVPLGGPRPWVPLAALALAAGAFFIPPIPWLSQAVPARQVTPVPVLIALSSGGDRIAVANDVGLTIKTVGERAEAAWCDKLPGPGSAPFAVGFDSHVTYLAAGPNDFLWASVMQTCDIVATDSMDELMPFEGAASGGLAGGALALADARTDVLCSTMQRGNPQVARRSAIDRALPSDEGRAVACAYAADGGSLLVAARSGKLFEFGLEKARPALFDRGNLPSSTGGGHTIAINRAGGDIAVVTTDGKVWVKRAGAAWNALDVANARAPLAISAVGDTIAFANEERQVAVWRTSGLPATLPLVKGDVASQARASTPKETTSAAAAASTSASALVAGPPLPPAPAHMIGARPVGITEDSSPGSRKITFNLSVPFLPDMGVASDHSLLDTLIARLKDLEVMEIVITGHTAQNSSSAAYSLKESARMADSVKAYLVANGISPTLVTTEGKGDRAPMAAGGSKKDQEASRRVTIQVVALSPEPLETGKQPPAQ